MLFDIAPEFFTDSLNGNTCENLKLTWINFYSKDKYTLFSIKLIPDIHDKDTIHLNFSDQQIWLQNRAVFDPKAKSISTTFDGFIQSMSVLTASLKVFATHDLSKEVSKDNFLLFVPPVNIKF